LYIATTILLYKTNSVHNSSIWLLAAQIASLNDQKPIVTVF